MHWGKISASAAGVITACALLMGGQGVRRAWAQEGGAAAQAKPQPKEPAKDYNQRSLEIFEFRKAAKSGTARGEEIFYYKCWYCHNEYAKGAPQLKGMYSRPKLISGQPVNDDTVKDKIRNGGPGMPAYKYALSDDDLNDLVAYLREKCCWNSDSPPLNPRYRAGK